MLVNCNKMLSDAKKEKKAIFHFNINNLEWTKAILEECNDLNEDVILGVSESAVDYIGGYDVVYSLCSSLIKDLNIKINVCLHLDHAHSYDSCKKAIDAGFTSVMIDASKYSFEENVKITKLVVEYAKSKNVSVEAELGSMPSNYNNDFKSGNTTSLEECINFVNQTKIDLLAPSVGTVHGIYKGELNIDYDLIKSLANSVNVPLVLHGGSSLSNDILKKCVLSGITKININSDLQSAWAFSIKEYLKENNDVIDPRKIINSGIASLKNEIKHKMNINN